MQISTTHILIIVVGVFVGIAVLIFMARRRNDSSYIGPKPGGQVRPALASQEVEAVDMAVDEIEPSEAEEFTEAADYADVERDLATVSDFDAALPLVMALPGFEEDGYDEAQDVSALRKALAFARTHHEAWQIYDISPTGSGVEREALELCLKLCETVDEAIGIIDECNTHTEFGQLAIVRAAELINRDGPCEFEE